MSITLTRFGNPIAGGSEGIADGNLEIAIAVTAQAKMLAPVDMGQLRNSIMYKTPVTSGGFNDGSGDPAPKQITVIPREDEAYVGTNLDYAPYQEFGTRAMAPQPYLRPAIDVVVKGTSVARVLAKINQETMRGALRKGQKRETF